MRVLLALVAALGLSACLFGGDQDTLVSSPTPPVDTISIIPTGAVVRPGLYRGTFGPHFDSIGVESELSLDSAGNFRWLGTQYNYAIYGFHGQWVSSAKELLFYNQFTDVKTDSNLPPGFFNSSTLAANDSSLLRQVSDSAFGRYELNPETLSGRIWAQYRRVSPLPTLSGRYVYSDTSTDSTKTVFRGEYLFSGGKTFVYSEFLNNLPYGEISDTNFTMSGSFLISPNSLFRTYDTASQTWSGWSTYFAGDVLIRLQHVSDTALEEWNPDPSNLQPGVWWHYRKEP